MSKKLYIQTWGCQMNEYDSARMADLLGETHHLERTDSPEDADILLLNTCSVREKAQEKVFSELGRWRKLKARNPAVKIGVGGCVASQEGDAILRRAPFVDMIFGPQTLHRLPNMINKQANLGIPVVDVTFPEIEKFDNLPEPKVEGPSAFVSIMEGCSRYCTFCVVPYTRGEEISRPMNDVLAECKRLAEQGVREIHLLGQNVNDWEGDTDKGDSARLAELISHVAGIPGVARIRFTTSHPLAFGDDLVDIYRHVPELVSFVHLPVQAGSDRILRAMKRGHDRAHYIDLVQRIRAARPDIRLSSDFIVGFPGETVADFEDTLALVRALDFDTSYSFIYSARPGTPAATLEDPVPLDTKKQWLYRLQHQLRQQASRHSRVMVGTEQEILVSGPSPRDPGKLSGRTVCNRVVNFPADDQSLIGQLVRIHIEEARPNSLAGRLITTEALA
jgi:tRNA-2-methylthio-N6-dimethylallyladenosine synthase